MLGARLARRELLQSAAAAALLPGACRPRDGSGIWVNDVHSGLNATQVRRLVRPDSVEALRDVLFAARRDGMPVAVMGGGHAMGGQQFVTDGVLLDTRGLDAVLAFDRATGHIEVGAGMQWPALIEYLNASQTDSEGPWGIVQKQTGADRLCLGGALAANVHGRGLRYPPIVGDVEAFTLVNAAGHVLRCSRGENSELFRLAIGGYGLFGVITSVRLRLAQRRKLERVVELVETRDLMRHFDARIADGFVYGDCQYSTDLDGESLLRRGVFSCYRPVPDGTPGATAQRHLSEADWLELIRLAHRDRARAFREYSNYYLSTSGQIYDSDTHQLSTYIDDYHRVLGARLGEMARGSEVISEIYVPRDALYAFLETVRDDFLAHQTPLIYGTIRLIEPDRETFLPWAAQAYACVIFNLHTAHEAAALAKTAADFRRLIDRGMEYGGSYFLTYHRWASRQQVLTCYPDLPELLRLKRHYDPDERFQSDWYRHHRRLLL